jgi:CIC family chloride channel protein
LVKKIIIFLLKVRLKYLPGRLFLVLLSIITGILAGLIAVVLKTSVHQFQNILTGSLHSSYYTYLYVLFPVAGLLLSTAYVQIFRKGNLSRGIGNVLVEINKNNGKISSHKLYSQMITSFFTLGFGGSAGLEAPISVTGAAIGSRLSIILRINERERMLLAGCGAAGGIAAIFNSPIAGVLFAVEIILSEMTIPAFVPLIISSAAATLISKLLYEGQPFKLITNEWHIDSIGFYILLGILCSFLSVYMIRVYYYVRSLSLRIKHPYIKAVVGALILGFMLFLFPPLFGEGYNIVEFLLDGKYTEIFNGSLFWQYKDNVSALLIFSFCTMMLKVIATAVTVSSGGNGGMFGSSLFVGALFGFIYARVIRLAGFATPLDVNFIVVAMAGILAGVIHAPLTAIFLIAEITGGYALFVPLMVVVSLSYFICRYFEPYSAYTKDIAERGEYYRYNRDMYILEHIKISQLIESDYVKLNVKDPFFRLVDAVEKSNRNIFPVVDDKNQLAGIVLLDNIREMLFDRDIYNLILVQDIMAAPPAVIDVEKDKLYVILKKLDEYKIRALPVVQNGVYIGFVSKANILTHYRNILVRQTQAYKW